MHCSPGQKLLALAVFGAAVFLVQRWWVLCLVAGAMLLLFPLAGVSLRRAYRMLRDLAFILAAICASQAWLQGPEAALITLARILALVWAAGLVTETTPFSDMSDALRRGLSPLRSFGVDPERLAFAMTLTMRLVPMLRRVLLESREAQQARGLGRSPLTLIVPVMIRIIRLADRISEAVEARGIFGEQRQAAHAPADSQ